MTESEIEQYDVWLLPKCIVCDEDIVLLRPKRTAQVFEFKCGCGKNRVETYQNYDIVSKEDVIMQTLYFNHALDKDTLHWVQENLSRQKATKDLYIKLRRRLILEEI